MVNIIIYYNLTMSYNFFKINYELKKNQVSKYFYVDFYIHKNDFKWNCKVLGVSHRISSSGNCMFLDLLKHNQINLIN